MYNDFWMVDQGLLQRERFGDLRDLIGRRFADSAVVSLDPDDTLAVAYQRFRLYDVSQLPVLEKDRIVGIVDESDVLLAAYGRDEVFQEPVRRHMTTRLETLAPDAPVDSLLPVFDQGKVPIVVKDGLFQGLITRIDLLNYLRRRATKENG
jgi:cystathionine beta-synthase